MDKNFNSFHQMLEGMGQKNFRSFKDWAQAMNGAQENHEKKEIEPTNQSTPVNEVHETAPEPSDKPEKDIISTLIENLDDFEWTNESYESEMLEEPLPQEPEKPVESLRSEPIRVKNEKRSPEKPKEPVEERVKHYKIFKDKEENFECNLKVEGTSLSDAKVRIVLESDSWNFVFHGKIYGDGRCVVPIKKGIPLIEGAIGSIKLEIVAEDQLFIGWEDTFRVEASKKIKAEVKNKKSISVDFNNRFNINH